MILSFAFILTLAVIITGLLGAIDRYTDTTNRWKKCSWLFSYSRSLFPVLLAVWLVRSFIIQPYHVPSGSLEPTIMPDDFIIVSQFAYGLHFPVTGKKFLNISEPKRGDIALFQWPKNPHIVFVKRVIGLPGDHIVYRNKVLYINGVKAKQKRIRTSYDDGDQPGEKQLVNVMQENLDGVKHDIYLWPTGGETENIDVQVPPHEYFMMGDNRDGSDDSRSWGFVPEQNLIGRAFGVLFSCDPVHHKVRWSRLANSIQ